MSRFLRTAHYICSFCKAHRAVIMRPHKKAPIFMQCQCGMNMALASYEYPVTPRLRGAKNGQ